MHPQPELKPSYQADAGLGVLYLQASLVAIQGLAMTSPLKLIRVGELARQAMLRWACLLLLVVIPVMVIVLIFWAV